jgi:shikimate dehydrogenase
VKPQKEAEEQPEPVETPSGRDLASSALAMARLEGEIARTPMSTTSARARKNIGTRADEYRFAQYIEDWRQKVERVGTLNYPEAAKGKLYGTVLTVTIRSDGSVDRIEIDRSSGHKVLDDAARRIVHDGRPLRGFPARHPARYRHSRDHPQLAVYEQQPARNEITLTTTCRYSTMTDHYCVFGNPIATASRRSSTPPLPRRPGRISTTGPILAPTDGFADACVPSSPAAGKGANVTVPFKEEAFRLATRRTPRAELAGAVNTLIFADDEIVGDNTDGVGLLRDIMLNLTIRSKGKRVLLLGAGGAARGVIGPLLGAHPAALVIANRTEAKAQRAGRALCLARAVTGCGFDDWPASRSTSSSMPLRPAWAATLPPLPEGLFRPGQPGLQDDVRQGRTPFLALCPEQGAGHRRRAGHARRAGRRSLPSSGAACARTVAPVDGAAAKKA